MAAALERMKANGTAAVGAFLEELGNTGAPPVVILMCAADAVLAYAARHSLAVSEAILLGAAASQSTGADDGR
ncbi:MAG: hypothetical protein AB7R90_10505 [Reyranellaceae bacterium]